MTLKDIAEKLKGAKEMAAEVGGFAQEKINELLEGYKKATAILETFGFKVSKFNVEIGLLPKISTSISGSIDNIKEDKIKQMIEENQGKKLLVYMLSALITAKDFQERADLKSLTGVTLDVTLGVTPKIYVDLHEGTGE